MSTNFPLILAFSLGEQKQVTNVSDKPDALGFVSALDQFLPLPKGEGWGEGEGCQFTQNEWLFLSRIRESFTGAVKRSQFRFD